MYRLIATSNSRTKAGALSALAAAIGTMMFTAAPAKADHLQLFFAPPFPLPIPVVVHHEVVYEQPRVVYERPRVIYERPVYYGHEHRRGCRHRDADWGYRGRGDWDHDDDQGGYRGRVDVGYRGRY
jgi:hypothetical protein